MFRLGQILMRRRQTPVDAGVRFLLITADIQFSSDLAEIASSRGWKLLCAHDLGEAISMLRSQPVPMAVYDWNPDGQSWRPELEQLAALQPQLCLLLASRVADQYLLDEVVRSGGYDLLVRSSSREELIRKIESAWFWGRFPGPAGGTPGTQGGRRGY